MAQEFTIKSEDIESKINQLLPSQGGFGAGVDFSASTMVVPIVDLTETAEGSQLRQDIQKAFTHDTLTNVNIANATNTTIVNTTGFYQVIATCCIQNNQGLVELNLFDGTTSKTLVKWVQNQFTSSVTNQIQLMVGLEAGDSLRGTSASSSANDYLNVSVRQIADINGNLISPT